MFIAVFRELLQNDHGWVQARGDNRQDAGTFDHVYVTLIGTKGESERTELDNFGVDFQFGMVSWIQLLFDF